MVNNKVKKSKIGNIPPIADRQISRNPFQPLGQTNNINNTMSPANIIKLLLSVKLSITKTLLKETKKTKEGAERKEKREGNSKRKSNTRPIMFREKGLINKTPSPSGYLAVTSLVKMLQGLGGKYLLTTRSIPNSLSMSSNQTIQ